MGIIGTPVIDKTRGVAVRGRVDAGGAAAGSGTGYTQRLHALDLATGADVPGSPVGINAAAFNPLMQNQRPA